MKFLKDLNPYCQFKDDAERRKALQSQDRRIVALARIKAAKPVGITSGWRWLKKLVPIVLSLFTSSCQAHFPAIDQVQIASWISAPFKPHI